MKKLTTPKILIIICILIAIGWFVKAAIDYLPMRDDSYWLNEQDLKGE